MKGEMVLEEAELVKRCQEGDLQAFEMLVERYSDMAVRTAYLVTGCREIAEDMAQEAFIQCFYSIKQFKHLSSFKTWFYRILIRVSRKMALKSGRRLPLEYLDGISGKEKLPDNYDLSEMCEDKQAREAVCKAVEMLNHNLKVAVVLHYFNDFSVKEVAQLIGCREGTVKSRLFKARRLLAEQLSHQGWDVCDENENRKETGPYVKTSLF